jgi:hypothetical protein
MTTTSYTGYSLYTYTGTTAGMAGRITDDGTTITPIPNMTTYTTPTPGAGDPQIEGFVDGANLRIAVAPYVGGTGETVGVYDATTGSLVGGVTHNWSSVNNMYGIEKIGSNFYVLDFDNARIVRVNSSYNQATPPPAVAWNFASDAVTGPLIPSGYVVHGQAIINIAGTLYGLFTLTDSSWANYQNSVLVKFTISGTGAISVGSTDYNSGIGKNAFALAVQGSDLYIACLGGRQNGGSPNTNSSLDKIAYGTSPLNGASVTQPVTYASVGYEIRDISFNGSTAYLLVGSYNASYVMQGKLLQSTTAFASFATINDFSAGAAGYYWAAQYIDNNRILFARGNEILYYNASSTGTPMATLTISAGSLEAAGSSYTNLNDLTYVGSKTTTPKTVRGYQSPTQVSRTTRGLQARAIAQGRPELTPGELERLEEILADA